MKNNGRTCILLLPALAAASHGAYLYISSKTKPPRSGSCFNALTGTAGDGAEVRTLRADVHGRIVVDHEDEYCLNGNGFKVDQGPVEPATASSWSREQAADFWQENYHSGDNAVDINAKYPVVENIVTHNTGNVAFADETKYITVRDVYVQHADDDAAESDTIVGANMLVDKAFTELAWRLYDAPRVDNVPQCRFHPQLDDQTVPHYGMHPGYKKRRVPGYNQVFKWEKDCEYAPKLEVRNTIRGR